MSCPFKRTTAMECNTAVLFLAASNLEGRHLLSTLVRLGEVPLRARRTLDFEEPFFDGEVGAQWSRPKTEPLKHSPTEPAVCLVGLIFATRPQPRALPPVPIASTSSPRSAIPLAGSLQLCRTPCVPHRSSVDTVFQTASPTSPASENLGRPLGQAQAIVTRLSLCLP
jgi:hypothetical protein